jgi:hypothetical protein
MQHSLVCFRHKVKGPKGGEKIVHAVELDGKVIFDNGSRREAQSVWIAKRREIIASGNTIDDDNVARDWMGKF